MSIDFYLISSCGVLLLLPAVEKAQQLTLTKAEKTRDKIKIEVKCRDWHKES